MEERDEGREGKTIFAPPTLAMPTFTCLSSPIPRSWATWQRRQKRDEVRVRRREGEGALR